MFFVTLVVLAGLGNAWAAPPPPPGSPEFAVRESLRLFRDGKVDAFIHDFCAPTKCTTPAEIESMRRYEFASAEKAAKHCLHGDDDSIIVTRRDGDPAKDDRVTIWVQCEETRRPVPSTQVKVDGKWMVSSFSW